MKYRNLTSSEIDQLERLGNWADDWSAVQVVEPFCAECLRGNSFEGAVRLGAIAQGRVVHGDLSLREGIYDSTLSATTVGDHPAIHHVRMLDGYTLGDNVLLFNVGEMTCSSDPTKAVWLEPMNENGGRSAA